MTRRVVCVARCVFSLAAMMGLAACIGSDPVEVVGGTLEFNPRLRADAGSSQDMPNGRFYGNGTCPGGSSNTDECRYATPLRSSMMTALNAQYINRLRRSEYLWVESDGFPILSYELIARNITLRNANKHSEVFARNVTVGTCDSFPILDPETRQPAPSLEKTVVANMDSFVNQADVLVHECVAPSNAAISELLEPVTDSCTDTSMVDILGNNLPGPPQSWPFCIVDRGFSALGRDASYSLLPRLPADPPPEEFWPGLKIQMLPILPHLKTVPIGGTRTISRELVRNPNDDRINADGSRTNSYTWRVGILDENWQENFSPNIVVTRARVRKGALSNAARVYLNVENLEVGNVECQTRDDAAGHTEFDIQMCDLELQGGFRVTPTYRMVFLEQGRVDDGQRLLWDARIRMPPTNVSPNDRLFIELDLMAVEPTASNSSSLTVAPASKDLGEVRVGAASAPLNAVRLQNWGPASVWIESIAMAGRDAAELGAARAYRVANPPTPAAAAAAPMIATPFILRSGSAANIAVLPVVQSMGRKEGQIVVTYRDAVAGAHQIMAGVAVNGVSPIIHVLPQTVYFYAQPGAYGYARAERAAILTNDGPIPFVRNRVTISGAHAGEFRILRAEYGLGASDASQAQTIESGAAEVYRFGFFPIASGMRTAVATVETNEGNLTINLQGSCDQSCSQPPQWQNDNPQLPPVTVKQTPRMEFKRITIKRSNSESTSER